MKRIVFVLSLGVTVGCLVVGVHARDLDGRYANSPLKPWFDHLASGKGLCCSMADGESVADPDWESKDGHFEVILHRSPCCPYGKKVGDDHLDRLGGLFYIETKRTERTLHTAHACSPQTCSSIVYLF